MDRTKIIAGLILLLAALGWMIFALRQQQRANEGSAALREVVRALTVFIVAETMRMKVVREF